MCEDEEHDPIPQKTAAVKDVSGGGLMGCMDNKKNSQGSTEGSTADSYSSGKKDQNPTEDARVIELD